MAVRVFMLSPEDDAAAFAEAILSAEEASGPPLQMKAMLLGPHGAGKTSIFDCLRRSDGGVSCGPSGVPASADFHWTRVQLGRKQVSLQVWDGLTERAVLQPWCHTFFRSVDAVVLVFDATDAASCLQATSWLQANDAAIGVTCVKALVANKVDAATASAGIIEQGRSVAAAYGWCFFETCAHDASNVALLFRTLARDAAQIQAQALETATAAAPPPPPRPRACRACPCVIS